MSKKNYTPQPIDTSDIQLPEELNPLLEAMAKNVHEIWAKERIAQGWTYGEKRDDTLKHHPCLVAYEDLPEEEKVYDRNTSVETLKRVSAEPGVKAIIFRSPCIAITKPKETSQVDPEKCIACGRCIRELGCPALIKDNKEPASNGKMKAAIDASLCTGCTLCEQICPVQAISGGRRPS